MSDIMEYDVILVGASPSSLTLALHLIDLAEKSGQELSMAILEKGKEIGHHSLSGALSNPRVLDKLFPQWKDDAEFPHEGIIQKSYVSVLGAQGKMDLPGFIEPPEMKKAGYVALTLSTLVKYMAEKIEKRAEEVENVEVDVFPGFAVMAALYNESGDGVIGVQVGETGDPESDFIHAKVVGFGEKGFVSRDIYEKFDLQKNPQCYAVGVKEVWNIQQNLEGQAWHTLGFPVLDGTLGGGFVYGLKGNRLAFGLIVSLDSPNPNIRPQSLLQEFKKHPWMQGLLKGGELVKYGASTLPEGGYHSLPEKFSLSGCVFLGDSLGVLDQKRLSGVDKAMESGWIAAEVIHDALQKGDCSEAALAVYKDKLMDSFVGKELYEGRNFRVAFHEVPELLRDVVPKMCSTLVDTKKDPGLFSLTMFGLKTFLSNPAILFKALKAKKLMNGGGPEQHNWKKDWEYLDVQYQPVDFPSPEGWDKSTLISCADAVYTAGSMYENEGHIVEFDAAKCVVCVDTYSAVGKDVPCVGDCTAEVHRLDEKTSDGTIVMVHGMSLENCVQCRTCEYICPHENLRVNAAPEGDGPNFMGL